MFYNWQKRLRPQQCKRKEEIPQGHQQANDQPWWMHGPITLATEAAHQGKSKEQGTITDNSKDKGSKDLGELYDPIFGEIY